MLFIRYYISVPICLKEDQYHNCKRKTVKKL